MPLEHHVFSVQAGKRDGLAARRGPRELRRLVADANGVPHRGKGEAGGNRQSK